MLNHIARRIPPIIKDLRSKDMPANTPHTLIPFLREPLMTEILRVKVVDFETGVVDVRGWVRRHEESVMVNIVLSAVDVCEDGDIACLLVARRWIGDVEEVRRREIEIARVPLQLCWKVLYTEPVVAELVDSGWTRGEAVEFSDSWLVRLVVVDDLLW